MLPDLQDQHVFARVLHANISPTQPVQSQEHLYGRDKQLQQIEQALFAPGRTVFVHGERGVGKTSLARTVAYSRQATAREPVLAACSPRATFAGIMQHVVNKLAGGNKRETESTTKGKVAVPFKAVPFEVALEHTRSSKASEYKAELGLNESVEALLQIAQTRQPEEIDVVVIDEFDRIVSDDERTHFADFIKQVGDQELPIRFVFCGVADSLQKLLGAHGSCYRYIEGVELQRLSWEARFEIINNAAHALGVTVGDHPRMRIASISDGFPHYVHLICEKMFWQMFNDPALCETPSIDHYREAVSEAVMGIEQHLKETYDKAVADAPEYEELLWAVADHRDFLRSSETVFDSYVTLFDGVDVDDSEEVRVLRGKITARLNALKRPSHASILSSVNDRRGWYRFTESIMRGYVRLRAEEQGLELSQDYSAVGSSSVNQAYPVRGARRSKRGAAKADWDRTKNPSGWRG